MIEREDVLEIIRQSTGGAECLTFGGTDSTWHSFDDWKQFPNVPAVYAIGLKLGVKYKGLVSKIVYVGSTFKMRDRMRPYVTGGSHNDGVEILSRRFRGGLECSFHVLNGINEEWIRALEDAVMQEAFRSFGCFPICNTDEILSKHRESCRGLVQILPCEELPFPQTLESLKLGNGFLRSYRPKEKLNTTLETTREDQLSGTFFAAHVGCWSQEKMERILELVGQLRPAKVRGNSKVKKFEAPTRFVPSPETWGEVALFKAREIAGTFYPTTEIWVKVWFEKTLLSQAKIGSDFFYGEDKSDVTETGLRESLDMDPTWKPAVSEVPAEFPSDFDFQQLPKKLQPKEAVVISVPESDSSDPVVIEHLQLIQSAHVYDRQVASKQARFEEVRAIQFIEDTAADKNLDLRIEQSYQSAVTRLRTRFGEAGSRKGGQ